MGEVTRDTEAIRAALELRGELTFYSTAHNFWMPGEWRLPALAALGRLVARLEAAERAARRVPSAEGGPGKEEQYWMRAKLGAAITHLRDLEDFYRLRGGTPTSFNQVRADRARQLHEAITEDFLNGSMKRPTTRERADAAEAELARVRAAFAAAAPGETTPDVLACPECGEALQLGHDCLAGSAGAAPGETEQTP